MLQTKKRINYHDNISVMIRFALKFAELKPKHEVRGN